MKIQNLTYVNEENEQIGLFLLNNSEGKKIWSMSQTSDELEYLVRKYHKNIGIPNWEFADNYDEGIEWVCFRDLFNNLTKTK
tara:strand:+ start:249 stop:494 length:246 start_codon:yes stop_codon:yes gene_type:complete